LITGMIEDMAQASRVEEIGRDLASFLGQVQNSAQKETRPVMPSPAAERKAADIADAFLDAELESDTEAKKWLVKWISAALEEAERTGYSKAMRKRF
jgi:hypothetical protein